MRCLKLADLSELVPGIRVGEEAFGTCGAQHNAMREEKPLRRVRVAGARSLVNQQKQLPVCSGLRAAEE